MERVHVRAIRSAVNAWSPAHHGTVPAALHAGLLPGIQPRQELELQEFQAKRMPYEVWSQDYQVELLAEDCALLTYKTAHVGEQGRLERHTTRFSIWQFTDGRWHLSFHQGTPAQAFAREAG